MKLHTSFCFVNEIHFLEDHRFLCFRNFVVELTDFILVPKFCYVFSVHLQNVLKQNVPRQGVRTSQV